MKAVYVDEELSESTNFKDLSEVIDFTLCNSLTHAFDLMSDHKFDIALCSMIAPPKLLKEFFLRFSKILPIIAISPTDDPKLAYTAANLQARDFISTKNPNYEEIFQSLHRIRREWIEEQKEKKIELFLQYPQNRIVLKELLMSEMPITQRIISNCVNEVQINDAIKKAYNLKTNEILSENPHILDSLVRMDIVIMEHIGQTLSCPNCNSVNIFANYFCNKCNDASFRRKNMCIHITCNHVIIKKKYNHAGEIFCPNCQVYFENASRYCSNILGFECRNCTNSFVTPAVSYSCNNCNYEKFSVNMGKWIELYKFSINQDYVNKIKDNFFSLMFVEDYLALQDYVVQQHEKFIFNENTYGPFDLVAYSENLTIIIITLNNESNHDIDKILEIEKLSKLSNKNIKTFAITLSVPHEALLKLLNKFDIVPLLETQNQDLINTLSKYLV
jgi:hypothetical protein